MRNSNQFLVGKHFPFLHALNISIDAISANGLIVKWHSDTNTRPDYKQEIQPNTMETFELGFDVWISLFVLPILAFIAENIIFRMTHKRNRSEICLFFDMLLGSGWHFLLNDIHFKNEAK